MTPAPAPTPAAPSVFFMHIMKTAGTSLAWNIRRNVPPEAVYPTGPLDDARTQRYWLLDEFDRVGPEERDRLRVFMGHFPFHANERFGADDVITVVREPVERTISHLLHTQRMPGNEDRSLEELYEGIPAFPTPLVDYQVRQFALQPGDADSPPLAVDEVRYRLALERLESVAVLGRTDRLGAFVDQLRARYGWRHEDVRLQAAPHAVEAPDHLVRRIRRDCAADLAFYADACALLERRAVRG